MGDRAPRADGFGRGPAGSGRADVSRRAPLPVAALLLGLTLLLAACAGGDAPAEGADGGADGAARSAAPPYDLFPRAEPAEVGLSPDGAAALVDTVEAWVEADTIVGAVVLVVHRGRTVLHRAVGMADRERGVAMRTDHIMRMRSMTKPLVGTAVLMLAEEGALALDDPVADHLPAFDSPGADEVTVFQLLTHTSGLTGSIYTTAEGTPFTTLRAAVDSVGRRGPTFEPGTSYAYSDPGTSTLGALVAEVSGLPAEDFIRRRILEPLGMDDSLLFLTVNHPLRERVASTYRRPEEGGGWVKYWDNTMPQVMPFFRASGGLYATAADYARFLAAMKEGGRLGDVRLLEPETVDRATSPRAGYVFPADSLAEMETVYGLHWTSFTGAADPESASAFGHGGSDGTYAWVDPDRDLIAVYLTQSRSTETRPRFRELVYRLLFREGPEAAGG